jgi:protein TonB
MAANNDIFSNEWCDLVFIGKNQMYGAYELRRNSARRHTKAMIIASVLFILAITGPGLLKSILPEKKEVDTTVRTLADIKLDQPKQENILKEVPPPPPPMRNTIKFTPPVIKPDEMVAEEDEPKMQKEVVEQKAAIGTVNFDKGTDDVSAPVATTKEQTEIVQEEEKPFVHVEQMPEFPGGMTEMNKFILKNLQYPVIASEMGVQGTVILQFVVGRDGKIGSIKVMRGIGSGCDEEAIRVLQKMPAWNPGRQGGKPVQVYFTLPIRFLLNKGN